MRFNKLFLVAVVALSQGSKPIQPVALTLGLPLLALLKYLSSLLVVAAGLGIYTQELEVG